MPEFCEDNAIVLACRRFGERAFVVSVITKGQGRLSGLYKSKQPPEPGTIVSARWAARLSEQLGHLYLDPVQVLSGLYLDDPERLACLASACALLNEILPERQPCEGIFQSLTDLLLHLDTLDFLKRYVLFEKTVLAEIGFGLDTSACAGGGDPNDLAYISPKTGRAVSREMGAPYRDKLLPLPRFLWQEADAEPVDIRQGLALTGYFLKLHSPKNKLPSVRACLTNENRSARG